MPIDRASDATRAVMRCQQQFWQALQSKDAALFARILADDFVCRSPGQADQPRADFITTIATMPIAVVSVTGEQLAIQQFGAVAVLTGTQVAQLRLPDGSQVHERLALTNIFRRATGQWQMVLAHPVLIPNQSPA